MQVEEIINMVSMNEFSVNRDKKNIAESIVKPFKREMTVGDGDTCHIVLVSDLLKYVS